MIVEILVYPANKIFVSCTKSIPSSPLILRPPRPTRRRKINLVRVLLIDRHIHHFRDAPIGYLLPMLAVIGRAENAEAGGFIEDTAIRGLHHIHRVTLDVIPPEMLPRFAGVVGLVEAAAIRASAHEGAGAVVGNRAGEDAEVLGGTRLGDCEQREEYRYVAAST